MSKYLEPRILRAFLFFLAVGRFAALPLGGMCLHVGEVSREFSDPERKDWRGAGARPLRTVVWYPVAKEAAAGHDASCNGSAVHVIPGAALASGDSPLPLVLLSHGSGNHADQLRWLGHALVGGGYLVAAVDHNGTSEQELGGALTATDFFAWERARDISVALDQLLTDATFGARIDPRRVGAAGFSLGGTTVLWLGGARLDLEQLRTGSPPPPPFLRESIDGLIAYSTDSDVGRASIQRAGRSYRDDRIRAIFALSPAMGPGFPEEHLRTVATPVHIAVGDADVITPAADHAKRFARAIPGARLDVLPGERGHYTRPIADEQRDAELAEVARLATAFFDATLARAR